MKKPITLAAIVAAWVLCAGCSSNNRYRIVATGNTVYRVDTRSGQCWYSRPMAGETEWVRFGGHVPEQRK